MDWKDIKDLVAKDAPLLGTLIGGPAGGTIGAVISSVLGVANTPDAVSQALATNPDAAVKIRQIESDERVKLQSLTFAHAEKEIEAAVQNAADANKTMQTEAAADHWPTYSWRPAIGFSVAVDLAGAAVIVLIAYSGVMFFGVKPEVLSYLPAMLGALAALVGVASPILGIASYFRGKMQASPDVPSDNRG
jgi:hypothetical protein